MTFTPMLATSTRREGIPILEVVLADGNTWGLALPTHRRRPVLISDLDDFGRPLLQVEVQTRLGYRLEIHRLWELVLAACRDGSADEQTSAFRHLVVVLLLTAHAIDRTLAEALVDSHRVDLGRIARALIPTAFGQGDLSCFGGR